MLKVELNSSLKLKETQKLRALREIVRNGIGPVPAILIIIIAILGSYLIKNWDELEDRTQLTIIIIEVILIAGVVVCQVFKV